MKVRSTVSADISMHVIWVNSTDFDSTVKAVKVHEILVNEFGYTDSLILEQGNRGKGVSISICDGVTIIRQVREDYAYAKKAERAIETTSEHRTSAKALLSCLYDD
ncbi:hypothetical protein L8R85_25865 [Vibrio splendidus]|uniref:Uncharacterized protein n=1 Tax=Vibrio splendidus TaxID=29497 RepID=A0AA43G3P5_VIBSP|nr:MULTISPECIES: hypothetical protein [Vibrio]CAH7164014.1 conserved hypothetical protein [Vibrio chagasii]CDT48496.1 conserved hypothetical protein [Vibrio coralliirubri]MDH5924411.1 hypothetical protein [Vibrio splendidus]ROO49534.1 hypothetical protein EDB58_1159 [Vibrio crassostreae]TCT59297.1 hypothetical protein EDB44_11727 [Vibrio crassostreae]